MNLAQMTFYLFYKKDIDMENLISKIDINKFGVLLSEIDSLDSMEFDNSMLAEGIENYSPQYIP